VACNTKNQLAESPVVEKVQQVESIISSVYRDRLNALPFEFESNRKGLDLFRQFVEQDKDINSDIALKDFLEFQKRLLDELNQQLYKRPDFETINSLIWADTTEYAPEAVKLSRLLNEQGLLFKATEGAVYIDRDMEPIRKTFYTHLSEPVRIFFVQYEMELVQGFSEDGGMVISTTELADRLGFWEEFLQRYPNNIFKEYATDNVKYYRYFMMAGMDNTPAFDYESNKLLDEYKQAMIYYQNQFAGTPSATVFRTYLEVLSKNNNQFGKAVEDFTDQYRPWD
jgi:hypothetical protein